MESACHHGFTRITVNEYGDISYWKSRLTVVVVTDGLTAADYIAFPDETLKAGMTCVPYDESTFDPDSSSSGMTDGSMTDGSMADGSMADMSGADNGGDVTAPAADGAVTDAPVEG